MSMSLSLLSHQNFRCVVTCGKIFVCRRKTMSSDNDSSERKRKKGVRHEEEYKRNQIKKAKVSGESHTNWKGRYVPCRNVPEFINLNCCNNDCLKKVNPKEALDNILISFYAMGSKDEQDIHLQRLIEVKGVERRRGRDSTLITQRKPKTKCFEYFLLINRQRTKVCKNAFINAHNITAKRVRRIGNLLESGITPQDMRGKHPCSNAVPADVCQKIHDHIASFPTKETHYASDTRYYLSADLSVRMMHKLFTQLHPELDVKYQFYWQYFRTNFSLSFGRPVVDACTECESLKTKLKDSSLNDNARRTHTAELLVHRTRSKKFYKKIQSCTQLSKDNNKVLSLCFDFMAVIDLPRIPVQDVYYFRQLSINTFGIYNVANNRVHTYVYHEGIAHKSPDDVCSFLLHYFQNFVSTEYDELNLFCDNCAGQNKNHAMVRFLMALTEKKMFKKINLYFPFRGHSFLPCDRSFGLIKRKLKKIERVYTVDEYVQSIIMECTEIKEKFVVYQPQQDIIYNFQQWFPEFYYKTKLSKNAQRGELKEKFMISKYHEFQFSAKAPHSVVAKEFIDGFKSATFDLRKTNQTNITLPLQKKYIGPVPIARKKMMDLKMLKEYIPAEFIQYWESIYSWPVE